MDVSNPTTTHDIFDLYTSTTMMTMLLPMLLSMLMVMMLLSLSRDGVGAMRHAQARLREDKRCKVCRQMASARAAAASGAPLPPRTASTKSAMLPMLCCAIPRAAVVCHNLV